MCWGNTKLKGITIPDKVTVIGENAFASCSALDSIQLGEKVDSLAGKAFAAPPYRPSAAMRNRWAPPPFTPKPLSM